MGMLVLIVILLQLDLGLSIFHVIEADFVEGLYLILACDPCVHLRIEEENHYFQIGMTPILLAAHNNNYRILSLLYEYGHRLTVTQLLYKPHHL